MLQKENKCDKCELKKVLDKAIKDTLKAQEYYLAQVREVNKTLAKYNKKIDELDKQ